MNLVPFGCQVHIHQSEHEQSFHVFFYHDRSHMRPASKKLYIALIGRYCHALSESIVCFFLAALVHLMHGLEVGRPIVDRRVRKLCKDRKLKKHSMSICQKKEHSYDQHEKILYIALYKRYCYAHSESGVCFFLAVLVYLMHGLEGRRSACGMRLFFFLPQSGLVSNSIGLFLSLIIVFVCVHFLKHGLVNTLVHSCAT